MESVRKELDKANKAITNMEAQFGLFTAAEKSNFKTIVTKARQRYDEARNEFIENQKSIDLEAQKPENQKKLADN